MSIAIYPTTIKEAESQLKRLEVWTYQLVGRVFIIDKTLGHDNNIMNAVAEIKLPNESLLRPLPGEHPQSYKNRIVAMKEPIAQAMVRAFQITSAYDAGDLEHG